MRRLAAEDDPSPSRAKETLTFEAFEALEKRGDAKLASNPTTYGDGEEEEDGDGEREWDLNASRTSDALRLVAVASARRGDELFNAFGDHGNALLLHKYGFVGGRTRRLPAGSRYLPNSCASDRVEQCTEACRPRGNLRERRRRRRRMTKGDFSLHKASWASAADRADPGAAAAAPQAGPAARQRVRRALGLACCWPSRWRTATRTTRFSENGPPPGSSGATTKGCRARRAPRKPRRGDQTRLAALPKGTGRATGDGAGNFDEKGKSRAARRRRGRSAAFASRRRARDVRKPSRAWFVGCGASSPERKQMRGRR